KTDANNYYNLSKSMRNSAPLSFFIITEIITHLTVIGDNPRLQQQKDEVHVLYPGDTSLALWLLDLLLECSEAFDGKQKKQAARIFFSNEILNLFSKLILTSQGSFRLSLMKLMLTIFSMGIPFSPAFIQQLGALMNTLYAQFEQSKSSSPLLQLLIQLHI